MKLFFSVGEPSGDLHGANLIESLKRFAPDIECVGYGGPKMAAAGCELHTDLTEYAVMWLSQVFRNLSKFRQLYRDARKYFHTHRPDGVVLIDYPGFNWWIARAARSANIPVYYYGTPQMWAWAGWRVRKMRRLVDHALCKLPFEADWFNARGCRATYVGHPYFDELSERQLDAQFIDQLRRDARPLVTILPGSRTQEVTNNLTSFLRAVQLIRAELPDVRVAIASFNERQAELARQQVRASGVEAEVYVGRTPELIDAAECCLACSGSVSLELLYHEKPSVILYSVPRLQYWVVRYLLMQVRYITLVNLLAVENPFGRPQPFRRGDPECERLPIPEYASYEDESPNLARHALEWLTDPARRQAKIQQLRALKARYAQAGASNAAAALLLRELEPSRHQRRAA